MVDGGVLLLPQHHEGDDYDGRYDNPSHHQTNDGTFVRTDILSEKHLRRKRSACRKRKRKEEGKGKVE